MTKNFKDIKGISEIPSLKKKAEEIMSFIFSKSQENLIRNRSVDTGFLLQSGIPPFWKNENTIAIGYDAPWAAYVEYGSPPHPVSGKRFEGWVKRKLGLTGKEATSVSWAIAMKIKKKGTEAKPFLRPAIEDAKAKYGIKNSEVKIV